jgi:hypothetical protein
MKSKNDGVWRGGDPVPPVHVSLALVDADGTVVTLSIARGLLEPEEPPGEKTGDEGDDDDDGGGGDDDDGGGDGDDGGGGGARGGGGWNGNIPSIGRGGLSDDEDDLEEMPLE